MVWTVELMQHAVTRQASASCSIRAAKAVRYQSKRQAHLEGLHKMWVIFLVGWARCHAVRLTLPPAQEPIGYISILEANQVPLAA